MVQSLGQSHTAEVTRWVLASVALAAATVIGRGSPALLRAARNSWFVFICGLRLSSDNCLSPKMFFSNFDKVKIEIKLEFCS